MKKYFISLCGCLLFSLFAGGAAAQDIVELSVPHADDQAWNKSSEKMQAVWSETDLQTDKYVCPSGKRMPKTLTLTAWRGERLHAKFLMWSGKEEGTLRFEVEEQEGCQWTDGQTTGFLRYVMTDELNKDGGGCGYRPDKTLFDSVLVADRIEPIRTLRYEARTVRPAWVSFDVPRDATPGVYKGRVRVECEGRECSTLPFAIRVIDRTMPLPEESKFHLDLWQNPFAVARVAGVPLWSKEHFEAMRPLMQRLARAGQRGITTSITHKPWNGQTYDYFENMITEIKKADGTWMYDYTVFDQWVEFMQQCGVGPYIYCYSVIPWELSFRYYDQTSNCMVDKKLSVNDPEFDNYWVNKLSAFADHLKTKGWFERTIIAMDERPKESMEAALRVIRKSDPDYKISLAGNYHAEFEGELFDLCIPYDAQYPEGVVDARRRQGKVTTFYTCCSESWPNTFTFSQPAEASAFGPIAAERGLDGYLRWAYNSWVESPDIDTRFRTWAGGDTYLVYPDNQSSARFEKLVEGIQTYEKIQVLKKNPRYNKALEKLLRPFAYGNINPSSISEDIRKLNTFLNSD